MRLVMSVVAALALTACGRSEPREAESTAAAAPTSTPAAEAADAAAAPGPSEVDFVGVWAERAELCGRGETWRFTHERLSAASGVSCAIEGAARSAEGWSLQTLCTAAGPPTPAAVTLATAGAVGDGGVTVSGGPFAAPVPLVRCTPPLSAASGTPGA